MLYILDSLGTESPGWSVPPLATHLVEITVVGLPLRARKGSRLVGSRDVVLPNHISDKIADFMPGLVVKAWWENTPCQTSRRC